MGRTILITGIARGLGKALATHFLACGDVVIGLSSSLDNSSSKNFKVFNVDISDEGALCAVFQELRKSNLVPKVIINNAAVSYSVPSVLTSKNHFQKSFEVNLLGAFLVTREAVKLMHKNGWGRIIFLSSINTILNSSGAMAYNTTKKGLEGIMATFSEEISGLDITFNALGLSIIQGTSMAEKLSETAKQEKQTLLTKPDLLSIEEVSHGIEFFLSPHSRNITNQILHYGGLRQ